MIKSYCSLKRATLYGKVFLTRFELLKSNLWSKTRLSSINSDWYVFPIKYGYCGSNAAGVDDVMSVVTPTKYA